jgi:NAD(P)H-dependent FMN reductase
MFEHRTITLYLYMQIEIISGSPRQQSMTRRLALFLEKYLSANTEHSVGLIDLREHNLPPVQKVYTSVTDTPEPFRDLARRMFVADAFVIVTPEYNGSYSPSMQNLFDHFPKQHHKAFGLVTGSPGTLGGIRAAMQLQQFVMALFGLASPYMLVVPGLDKKFDEEGTLTDPSFQKNIDVFVKEYLWLAEKLVAEGVNA